MTPNHNDASAKKTRQPPRAKSEHSANSPVAMAAEATPP